MDIAIIGGGPAGAYLGYCLSKEGITPTIFDHSHPREKPCGGGISCLAISNFPILHEIPVEKAEGKTMRLISPKGKEVVVEGDVESWSISRKVLDGFILGKALNAGTRLIDEKVEDIERNDKGWQIKTKAGIYKAQIIVGADGVRSLVRKKVLGPIPKENLGICYGCFAYKDSHDETVIKFLHNLEGYAWIFPREDHLSIGAGVELKNGGLVKKEFEKFMGVYAEKIKPYKTWTALVPSVKDPHFWDLPASGDDWLIIGDAAGHVDPITAEGITYALWSAELASKAILKADLLLFDKLWREEYGNNFKKASAMRRLFFNTRLLELSIRTASKSRTYGKILYDVINSIQDYQTLVIRVIKDAPKIMIETCKESISG